MSVNYKKNLTEISKCRGIAVKPTLGCKDGGQSTEGVRTTSPDQKHLIPPRKLQRGEGQALLSDRGFPLPKQGHCHKRMGKVCSVIPGEKGTCYLQATRSLRGVEPEQEVAGRSHQHPFAYCFLFALSSLSMLAFWASFQRCLWIEGAA